MMEEFSTNNVSSQEAVEAILTCWVCLLVMKPDSRMESSQFGTVFRGGRTNDRRRVTVCSAGFMGRSVPPESLVLFRGSLTSVWTPHRPLLEAGRGLTS